MFFSLRNYHEKQLKLKRRNTSQKLITVEIASSHKTIKIVWKQVLLTATDSVRNCGEKKVKLKKKQY